jgi:cyclopropane-fatty-acyl-phospholipid synthase
MSTSSLTLPPEPGQAVAAATAAIAALFNGLSQRNFRVRLWDGTVWAPADPGPADFTIVVRSPGALRRLLWPHSEAALAEAYLVDALDIEGDIFAVPAVGREIIERRRTLREKVRVGLRLAAVPVEEAGTAPTSDGVAPRPAPLRGPVHSLARDRAAVTHHYDLSNRFYQLFLDPAMAYSCAVFEDVDEDLATAQHRKLDLACRKLRLRPGERLLDVGCGWGALIIHAARDYGVEAVGITLSERQAELARARIAEAGVADRCIVELVDYRRLQESGSFDKAVSIGMFEHVGRARAPEYFATVHRMLRPGGAYLHHTITRGASAQDSRGATVTGRYVFPDHQLLPVAENLELAEKAGFDIRDVENLREHYALTLRRWVAALEARHDEAAAEVGEATWRAWRLVFAGSAHGFETGRQGLIQALLVKPHTDGRVALPLGRGDWYD